LREKSGKQEEYEVGVVRDKKRWSIPALFVLVAFRMA
jgi:hypothetical protein